MNYIVRHGVMRFLGDFAPAADMVYRRSQGEMPAYEFEQEMAKTDGAELLLHVVPVEILSNGTGHVTGLKLARTVGTDGKLQVLPGTEFVKPFDMVITAIALHRECQEHLRCSDVVQTEVTFRPLTDNEIEAYLKTARTESTRWPLNDTPAKGKAKAKAKGK